MATLNHNRAQKRPLSRPGPALKNPGTSTIVRARQRKSGQESATAQDARLGVSRLCRIRAVLITAAAALQKQNADLDGDVALTLRHAAIDPLTTEIEKLEALLDDSEEAPC